MPLNEREKHLLNRIEEWERQLKEYEPTDFEYTYDQWFESTLEKLPDGFKENMNAYIDQWLFYIHASIQHTNFQKRTIEQLIKKARLEDSSIEDITSMKKLPLEYLDYIASEQIQKHQWISLIQGGLAGTGRPLFFGTDIISMIVINLRAIQIIAATYGFDIQRPFEQMLSLKIFYVATLPKRFQLEAWNQLWKEVQESDEYYYYGDENITSSKFIHFSLKQLMKGLAILTFKNKEKPSILSITVGAGSNYRFTKSITQFAQTFYQYRLLKERQE